MSKLSIKNTPQQAITGNIKGAPFKIGDVVTVCCITDSTGDKSFLGSIGIIVYFDYACGCGQEYPHDPMIGVLFLRRNIIEEFWREELISVTDGRY